ncbi:MAG: acyl-CoA desaturase [Planctomycetota bacterium]|nr:acyl-CoA desaturase [Planctomycetota bacterium]
MDAPATSEAAVVAHRPFRPVWGKLLPFVIVHTAAVAGVVVVGVEPAWVLLAAGLYVVRVLGTTLGLHRYFSHRSFRTSRWFQLVLALWANTTLMRGPIQWAANHRHHHRTSDGPADFHSPGRRGLLHAHVLWFLDRELSETPVKPCRDLERYPELRFLDRYYPLPAYALAAALYALGGWPWFVWGFLVSTVLTWHAVFLINSGAHVWGSRRYDTPDDSRNNALLALLLLGEGWHNNHHHDMHAAWHGRRWWEVDLTYYALRALAAVGLVWGLRRAGDARP